MDKYIPTPKDIEIIKQIQADSTLHNHLVSRQATQDIADLGDNGLLIIDDRMVIPHSKIYLTVKGYKLFLETLDI